jgi:hypothetical protein
LRTAGDCFGFARLGLATAVGLAGRRCCGCRRLRFAARIQLEQPFTHRDRRAFGGEQLRDHAGLGRVDLAVGLVGEDLDDGLILVDALPLLNQPLSDGALDDALAELRHANRAHVEALLQQKSEVETPACVLLRPVGRNLA